MQSDIPATTPAILAFAPSPFVTLQDAGRFGWQRYGIARAGVMDAEAMALANALVGNPAETAVLEFANQAGTWEVAATSCRIAVAGGRFAVFADDVRVPALTSLTLLRGQHLRIGPAADAVWGSIAVQGGFDVAAVLGSRSTHPRSAIGGFAGRRIQPGDRLALHADSVMAAAEHTALPGPARARPEIRVVLGPQQDYFTDAAIAAFLGHDFTVTAAMDRLGYRLRGPTLEHAKGFNIVSDGVVAGSIQVPGSGEAIVLMRDATPPGGYPKIATVISADLARLAQSRPGSPIRFVAVTLAQAQAARRRHVDRLASVPARVVELPGTRRRACPSGAG